MNVGYVHTPYKLFDALGLVGWSKKVRIFFKKNPPAEFSGYGPALYKIITGIFHLHKSYGNVVMLVVHSNICSTLI